MSESHKDDHIGPRPEDIKVTFAHNTTRELEGFIAQPAKKEADNNGS